MKSLGWPEWCWKTYLEAAPGIPEIAWGLQDSSEASQSFPEVTSNSHYIWVHPWGLLPCGLTSLGAESVDKEGPLELELFWQCYGEGRLLACAFFCSADFKESLGNLFLFKGNAQSAGSSTITILLAICCNGRFSLSLSSQAETSVLPVNWIFPKIVLREREGERERLSSDWYFQMNQQFQACFDWKRQLILPSQ